MLMLMVGWEDNGSGYWETRFRSGLWRWTKLSLERFGFTVVVGGEQRKLYFTVVWSVMVVVFGWSWQSDWLQWLAGSVGGVGWMIRWRETLQTPYISLYW